MTKLDQFVEQPDTPHTPKLLSISGGNYFEDLVNLVMKENPKRLTMIFPADEYFDAHDCEKVRLMMREGFTYEQAHVLTLLAKHHDQLPSQLKSENGIYDFHIYRDSINPHTGEVFNYTGDYTINNWYFRSDLMDFAFTRGIYGSAKNRMKVKRIPGLNAEHIKGSGDLINEIKSKLQTEVGWEGQIEYLLISHTNVRPNFYDTFHDFTRDITNKAMYAWKGINYPRNFGKGLVELANKVREFKYFMSQFLENNADIINDPETMTVLNLSSVVTHVWDHIGTNTLPIDPQRAISYDELLRLCCISFDNGLDLDESINSEVEWQDLFILHFIETWLYTFYLKAYKRQPTIEENQEIFAKSIQNSQDIFSKIAHLVPKIIAAANKESLVYVIRDIGGIDLTQTNPEA